MKHTLQWFSLVLAMLMLLCTVACTDGKQPTGDPLTPPDNTQEGNETPEGNRPEDDKPAFDVQAAENETIV
ncbi:MAG: hypothetical protein E7625_07440 [Ruminococcaceae bacterium]|nr:hypothetical protein [Oscillospiraceae bacterium]